MDRGKVHVTQGALDQTPQSPIGFSLLALPAELRYQIYSFVLPTNLTIEFKTIWQKGKPLFVAYDLGQYGEDAVPIGGATSCLDTGIRPAYHLAVETQLFRVSKFVSNESRSVLYGMNTYKFTIHGRAIWPKSLRSPYVFGSLGHPLRLPLLRDLRRIHIDVVADVDSHWAVKRQRARLEYLVEILKEHADDQNKGSLLQHLRVDFRLAQVPDPRLLPLSQSTGYSYLQFLRPPKSLEKYMFGLESLALLRGIKDVQVNGLPDWYAKCMQLCIQGKGGQVQETDWPQLQVKRSRGRGKLDSRKTTTHWVTLRKWHQPMLNWKEFAERNDITLPDDIDRFWAE